MNLPFFALACGMLVSIVLFFSALNKIRDFNAFAYSLSDDFRIPERYNRSAAIVLLMAELLALALILTGGQPARWGMALSIALMLMFTVVLLNIVTRGQTVYCRCFGPAQHPISVLDVLRNSVYLAAAGLYLLQPALPTASIGAFIALLLAALIVFLATARVHDIAQLLR